MSEVYSLWSEVYGLKSELESYLPPLRGRMISFLPAHQHLPFQHRVGKRKVEPCILVPGFFPFPNRCKNKFPEVQQVQYFEAMNEFVGVLGHQVAVGLLPQPFQVNGACLQHVFMADGSRIIEQGLIEGNIHLLPCLTVLPLPDGFKEGFRPPPPFDLTL